MRIQTCLRLAFLFLLLAAICGPLAATADAAELAGVAMSDRAKVGDQSVVLNGLALRKKAIFKVYVAGLYLPQKQSDATAILGTDAPRMLVMEFVRSVGKDSLTGAWDECLANNAANASADVKKAFEQLNGWMDDVESGDRVRFAYEPGKGTTVVMKNTSKGTLPGLPFADALFACWIGDAPPSEDFKASLLGR